MANESLSQAPIQFDLNDLCEQADVTARTVRYYIQQGLLPSPGLGSGARYGSAHLARLLVIRRLQREHLPLAEIRRRLESLDDADLLALVETTAPAATISAVDYVRTVLATSTGAGNSPPTLVPSSVAGGSPLPVSTPAPGSGARAGARGAPDRAQWERITLTPDVEVHVRRPLSREDNRRVDKLLEQAREIFKEEV
jgi:DNA-binding transcriptional MerR regulator